MNKDKLFSGLNEGQTRALRALLGNENVFLTGAAGSGKSFVINRFMDSIADRDREKTAVVASTGSAAILIDGRTFHSFFGLGVMQGGIKMVVKKATENWGTIRRIKETRTVIIDEISMLDGETLTAADLIAKSIRGSDRPWGGIRVIAVGDFAQLPPVSRDTARKWCFLSDSWRDSKFNCIFLTESMRSAEASFLKALNDVRVGNLTDDVRSLLESRTVKSTNEAADKPGTRLFGRRADVENYNLAQLRKIDAPEFVFPTAFYSKYGDTASIESAVPVPKVLALRVGALVMIRVNDRSGRYVNGSLARVTEIGPNAFKIGVKLLSTGDVIFLEKHEFNRYDGAGKIVASAVNFPLSLAWASTIHKSQGCTIDKVVLDLGELWDAGQAYVAMSRVRRAEDMEVIRWSAGSIIADPVVIQFHDSMLAAGNTQRGLLFESTDTE